MNQRQVLTVRSSRVILCLQLLSNVPFLTNCYSLTSVSGLFCNLERLGMKFVQIRDKLLAKTKGYRFQIR